jgi:O-antigen ligase
MGSKLTDRRRSLASGVVVAVMALMVAVEASNASDVFVDRLPVSLFTTVLGLATLVAILRLGWLPLRVPWLAILAWIGWILATSISQLNSALDPDNGAIAVDEALRQLVFLAVLTTLATGLRHWWVAAAAIAAPMAVIGGLAGINQWLLSNSSSMLGFETVSSALGVGVLTARHAGPVADPNFWGRFLVIGLAFAIALAAEARRRGSRVLLTLAAGGIGLLVVGIYLTGSRGAFLAAGVAVLVYLVAASADLRRVFILGPLAAIGLLLIPGIGSRLLSAAALVESGQRAAVDSSVLERIATQRVALRMIEAHPILGVGPRGYLEAFPSYAATTDLTLSRVVAPHDLYLEIWAQTGLLGLVAWSVLIGSSIFLGVRALRHLSVLPAATAAGMRPYVAAALAAIIAWSVASIFLHLSYVRVLLIVIALISVLEAAARRAVTDAGLVSAKPRAIAARAAPRDVVLVSRTLAGLVAGSLAALVLVGFGPRESVAVATGTLQPARDSSYLVDLRTRTAVVPTYAVLVGESGTSIDAQGDPTSGLINLSAEGDGSAERINEAIRGSAATLRTAGLDRLYTINWSEVGERHNAVDPILPAAAVSVGLLLGLAAAQLTTTRRRGGRSRGAFLRGLF